MEQGQRATVIPEWSPSACPLQSNFSTGLPDSPGLGPGTFEENQERLVTIFLQFPYSHNGRCQQNQGKPGNDQLLRVHLHEGQKRGGEGRKEKRRGGKGEEKMSVVTESHLETIFTFYVFHLSLIFIFRFLLCAFRLIRNEFQEPSASLWVRTSPNREPQLIWSWKRPKASHLIQSSYF